MDYKALMSPTETRSRTVEDVQKGQIWKHFKGHIVKVIAVSTGSEDGQLAVVYKHVGSSKVWHRPIDMFLSQVDHERYPQVDQKYRFELVMNKDE